MTTNKPIKRSKAFVQFSKDHHFGLLLVWKIRQDLDQNEEPVKISRYVVDFFTDSLQQHFKEEEELIFSRLSPGDPMRRQAEDEHRKIYENVESLRSGKAGKQLLIDFSNLLEAHIRFEERSLFNHLQKSLAPHELETLVLYAANQEKAGKKPNLFTSN